MVLALLGLGACGSGDLDIAPAQQAASPACRQVDWPGRLGDLPARPTPGDDPALAAWGDPAVIARCGVPALGPTTDECLEVDGQDWVLRRLTDGYAFTSYGTDPAIEVLVPHDYAPETMVLPDFTAAAQSLPRSGRACIAPG